MDIAAPQTRRTRLLAVLLIGPIALIALFLAFWLYYRWAQSGISGWLADAFKFTPIKKFGTTYIFRILLPIYLVAGIGAWMLTLVPALLLDRPWVRAWKGREALGFGLSAMVFAHVLLWWEVPTTLWVIPLFRRFPLGLVLPILTLLSLVYPVLWLVRRDLSAARKGAMGLAWLGLWSLLVWAPRILPRPLPPSRGGTDTCQVLTLGIDGLRSDTFLDQAKSLQGIRYENAYTPIPATRLLWHILWGGDPLFYTVGHVGPSLEEFQNPDTLRLLREAKQQGWKPRFYIDDGGTIGLAERKTDLDDALMPAEGWENFVNSNLAVSFPLYAAWENWFKPFPTTNPWAPLDAGLKEALRLGRGSKWVMFHSCLAHQPIFLSRKELAHIPRWWALPARRYQPLSVRQLVSQEDGERPDLRTNPLFAYQLRMDSILKAWEPIWNALPQDPSYGGAVRILFSDHGERFHNVGPNGYRLQGVHGYNLDPWECRTAMLAAGPGFSDKVEPTPRTPGVSLLGLRDGIARMVRKEGPFDAAFFEGSYPKAPIRYHTLDRKFLTEETQEYRDISDKDIAADSYIGPNGVWYTEYGKPAAERAQDVSVGVAEGPDLWVWKPLLKGGAHAFHYRGYDLQSDEIVDQETFQKKKAEIEALFTTLDPKK